MPRPADPRATRLTLLVVAAILLPAGGAHAEDPADLATADLRGDAGHVGDLGQIGDADAAADGGPIDLGPIPDLKPPGKDEPRWACSCTVGGRAARSAPSLPASPLAAVAAVVALARARRRRGRSVRRSSAS